MAAEVTSSTLFSIPGSRPKRVRRGLGEGSGLGKTAGRGHKGHGARSGYRLNPGYEGGQTPLHRRLPKIGFTSFKKDQGINVYKVFDICKLQEIFADSKTVSVESLMAKGMIKSPNERYKILGNAKLEIALKVEAHASSKGAKISIENAGGTFTLI